MIARETIVSRNDCERDMSLIVIARETVSLIVIAGETESLSDFRGDSVPQCLLGRLCLLL